MKNLRAEKGIRRGAPFEIEVDGERLLAHEGETVAAALTAAGRLVTGYTRKKHEPRGVCCGIGLCYSCVMIIDGIPNTRACQSLATPGCRVETQHGQATEDDG